MSAAASSPVGSSHLAHLQVKIKGIILRGRLLLPAARGRVVSLAPVKCGGKLQKVRRMLVEGYRTNIALGVHQTIVLHSKNVYCHLFGDIVCIATSILLRSVREVDKSFTSNPRVSILGSFWKMLSLKVLKLIRKCDSHSLIKTEKNKLMVIVLRYHIFRKVSNNNITYIQKLGSILL